MLNLFGSDTSFNPVPRKVRDLTGQRFGKWLVMRFVRTQPLGRKSSTVFWWCKCDCGTEREVRGSDLKQGNTNSCGCSFGRDVDLTGQRFGKLVVIKQSTVDERTTGRTDGRHWHCVCDCGVRCVVAGKYLKNGDTASCGCVKRNVLGDSQRTHGKSRTRIYSAWCAIRSRCQEVGNLQYPDYGGRGIKVCERWQTFENFYADMGDGPGKDYSVDRIDNDGDYCPENCRWSSATEQNNNTRRNRMLTLNGETMSMSMWAKRTGISYRVIQGRLRYGWSDEKILTTPAMKKSYTRHEGSNIRSLWSGMIYRCHSRKDAAFTKYGARGITVCSRWRKSFDAFLEDMGPRPTPYHSIDRIDNNKGYSPDNCRWATAKQQINNRRNSKLLTMNGETLSQKEWSERLGIPHQTIAARLKRGLSVEDALKA